jgi:hypothetical protein
VAEEVDVELLLLHRWSGPKKNDEEGEEALAERWPSAPAAGRNSLGSRDGEDTVSKKLQEFEPMERDDVHG